MMKKRDTVIFGGLRNYTSLFVNRKRRAAAVKRDEMMKGFHKTSATPQIYWCPAAAAAEETTTEAQNLPEESSETGTYKRLKPSVYSSDSVEAGQISEVSSELPEVLYDYE